MAGQFTASRTTVGVNTPGNIHTWRCIAIGRRWWSGRACPVLAVGIAAQVDTSSEAAAPDAATLDAALRGAARAERATVRAEAAMLDLRGGRDVWLERPGGTNSRVLNGRNHAGDTILEAIDVSPLMLWRVG